MKELRLLSISNTKLVDDDIIEIIQKSCPNIYYLDIGNCGNITDKSMEFIKDLKIQKLNLLKTQVISNLFSKLFKIIECFSNRLQTMDYLC